MDRSAGIAQAPATKVRVVRIPTVTTVPRGHRSLGAYCNCDMRRDSHDFGWDDLRRHINNDTTKVSESFRLWPHGFLVVNGAVA